MTVAAYARYSSDGQREESIDAQVRAIKKYCKSENYNLIKIYADEALSGRTDNRPQFQQMISDGKKGLFGAVIVHKFDRFARNRYDSTRYKYELKQYGIRVFSVLEQLDDTPEAVLIESLYEGMAEYFSLNLAREVWKGMLENVEQNLTTGGTPPLGFDFIEKKYVLNPYEAEAVRIIFNMYAADYKYNDIIQALNSKGYVTKKGAPFGKNSLYEILKNEKYIGNYVYNVRAKGKKNNHARKDEAEIIRKIGAIPAIITKEVWDKVQAKMKIKSDIRSLGKYKAKEKYLLTGKIFCGCGARMHGNRRTGGNGGKYVYTSYNCAAKCGNSGIEKNKIEDFVIQELKNYFTEEVKKELIAKLEKTFKENQATSGNEIESLKKELSKTKQQIEGVVQAIVDGMYHPSMKEKMNQLEAKKADLEFQIQAEEKYTIPTLEQFEEYLQVVLRFDTEENKARAIDTFVDSVIVYNDKIDLNVRVENFEKNGKGYSRVSEGAPSASTKTKIPLAFLC